MLAVLGAAVLGATAGAHELDVASAQVTLRDGHVAVVAHVDVLLHMEKVRGPSDVPLGLLAVVDPDAFVALATRSTQALQQGTVLLIDGVQVIPVGWHLPDPVQLQADAQHAWLAQAVNDPIHATLAPVSFEVRLEEQPDTVTLALPRSVGPVLVSFVRPVGQLAPAGSAVRLNVPTWATSVAPASAPQGLDEAL